MTRDRQLSRNFWLRELVKSNTADRLRLNNWPDGEGIIQNLIGLCEHILQPVRDHYKVSITPSSGYRSLGLNTLLRSKPTSKHVTGQAVDFEVYTVSNYELALWIEENLDFDQLILEFYEYDEPHAGWVHCSYLGPDTNRREVLSINHNGTRIGLVK